MRLISLRCRDVYNRHDFLGDWKDCKICGLDAEHAIHLYNPVS